MIPATTPRIDAIKSLAEAKGRESFAHLLAFGTHYSVDTCQRLLQIVPRKAGLPSGACHTSAMSSPDSAGGQSGDQNPSAAELLAVAN
jgi:hypothetical protein